MLLTIKKILKTKPIVIITILFFLIGLINIFLIIPATLWDAPDEVGHFSYVHYIVSEKRLPYRFSINIGESEYEYYTSIYDQENNINNSIDIRSFKIDDNYIESDQLNWISQHPPAYYLLMAPFFWLCQLFTKSIVFLIYSVRVGTLLLGCTFIYYLYKTAILLNLLDSERKSIIVMLAISPPISYYFSVINNDSLTILISLIMLYYLLKYFIDNKPVDLVVFVFSVVIAILTKYTIVLVIIPYLVYFCYKNIRLFGLKKTFKMILLCLGLGVLLLAPFYKVLYNGLFYFSKWYLENSSTTIYYGGSTHPADAYTITLYDMIVQHNYLDQIFQHIVYLTGWKSFVLADNLLLGLFVLLPVLSAFGYLGAGEKTNQKLWLPHLIKNFILFSLIYFLLVYFAKLDHLTAIYFLSLLIILVQLLFNNIESEKEISIFFAGTIIIVIVAFLLSHIKIANERDMLGAMHGRYYYIVAFPYAYIVIKGISKLLQKHNLNPQVSLYIFFGNLISQFYIWSISINKWFGL